MSKVTVSAGSKPRIQIPARDKQAKPKKMTSEIERIGVSVEVASIMLGLSVRSVWVLIKDGRIRHVKFGTRCIVSVQSIREFVDGKETQLEICIKPGDELIPQ